MTRVRFGGDTGLELEDCENSSDLSRDSMPTSAGDHKLSISSSSSPKKSRKALQRKVVSIPIKNLESSSRNKGEASPPSDSWAWRKYGQKPIKGSPYPRGYYRCSSSKGCPARKQVERSRVDPTMLVVTYSSDHNHSLPPSSRNRHSSPPIATVNSGADDGVTPINLNVCNAADTKQNISKTKSIGKDDDKIDTVNVAANDDLQGWFSDMGFFSMLESPMLAETSSNDTDVWGMFPIMGEEEEYLFADLGELPECSVVFRRKEVVAAGGTQWRGTTS